MTITKRLAKGSPLTYEELDGNFDAILASIASLENKLGVDFGGSASDYHDVTSIRPTQLVYYANARSYPINVVMICSPVSQNSQALLQVTKNASTSSIMQNSVPAMSFSLSIIVPANASYRWYFSGMEYEGASVQLLELY